MDIIMIGIEVHRLPGGLVVLWYFFVTTNKLYIVDSAFRTFSTFHIMLLPSQINKLFFFRNLPIY